MRKIKFRAWDGLFMRQLTELHLGWETGGAEGYYEDEKHGRQRLPKHGIELMQYTGLKDKNGKEIYEGDVVQHRRLTMSNDGIMYGLQMQMFPNKREVKFEGCGFTPFAGWIDSAHADLEWEIIGNIYENSELLK